MKQNFLKPIFSGICLAAVMAVVSASAIPTPYEIPGVGQDIAKNGTGINGANGNNAANNFFRLTTVLAAYGGSLPTPVYEGFANLDSRIVPTGGLLGYDYAVLHYGAGQGGTPGGGIAVYYLDGASGFTFPANGTGTHGYGGFSSLTLFKGASPVPDSGSTITLLGFALTGVGLLRRKIAEA